MNTLGYFVDDSLMMEEPTYEESDDSILRLAKFIKIYYDEIGLEAFCGRFQQTRSQPKAAACRIQTSERRLINA